MILCHSHHTINPRKEEMNMVYTISTVSFPGLG